MLSPGVAVVVAVLLMLLTDCVPAALARFAGSDPRIVEQRAELARLNGELANTSRFVLQSAGPALRGPSTIMCTDHARKQYR